MTAANAAVAKEDDDDQRQWMTTTTTAASAAANVTNADGRWQQQQLHLQLPTTMETHGWQVQAYKVRSYFLFSLLYLLIMITTADAAPIWGSCRLWARRDTHCMCLFVFDAITHPSSMETDPSRVSLHARCCPSTQRDPSQVSVHTRCRPTPFEHRDRW